MIPQAFITEWSAHAPWQTHEQIEQDLVINRALVEIFSDEQLAENLGFRGGTAIHKLYLVPQIRYSEDIDLVQIQAGPIKLTIEAIQNCLSFLGMSTVRQKANGVQIIYHFNSEFQPDFRLRLKVEINTREHFTVLGYQKDPFDIKSSWFTGSCELTSYKPEELLGTKLRALYQRKKGRDLYDIYSALTKISSLDVDSLLKCYHEYMQFVVKRPPSQKQFFQNLEAKMEDPDFLGDIVALIRPEEQYNHNEAFQSIKSRLIARM